MQNKDKLKCASCGGALELEVYFDGCDWDSVKGEGSGFKHGVALVCSCGRSYTIGRVKNEFDFCENVEPLRPYGKDGAQ